MSWQEYIDNQLIASGFMVSSHIPVHPRSCSQSEI